MTDSTSGDVHDDPSQLSEESAKGGRTKNDLDERQTPTLSAWQLRERMKSQNRPSYQPKAVSRTPQKYRGEIDPSLPPAFRAAAIVRQRKKEVDDFMSLDSVHSNKTQLSMITTNDSDSAEDLGSFGSLDSFASLGEDDHDDEAYREGRNQIARQIIECSQTDSGNHINSLDFRLQKGLQGTPLDFIAE
jgi:hypothetical protein